LRDGGQEMNECIVCGETFPLTELTAATCIYTGGSRCSKGECLTKARKWKQKRDEIISNFAIEKERILKPWIEKLNSELFLLDREYLKGKEKLMQIYIRDWDGKLISLAEHECRYFRQYDGEYGPKICIECGEKKREDEDING